MTGLVATQKQKGTNHTRSLTNYKLCGGACRWADAHPTGLPIEKFDYILVS
jgi:hypothetical protein